MTAPTTAPTAAATGATIPTIGMCESLLPDSEVWLPRQPMEGRAIIVVSYEYLSHSSKQLYASRFARDHCVGDPMLVFGWVDYIFLHERSTAPKNNAARRALGGLPRLCLGPPPSGANDGFGGLKPRFILEDAQAAFDLELYALPATLEGAANLRFVAYQRLCHRLRTIFPDHSITLLLHASNAVDIKIKDLWQDRNAVHECRVVSSQEWAHRSSRDIFGSGFHAIPTPTTHRTWNTLSILSPPRTDNPQAYSLALESNTIRSNDQNVPPLVTIAKFAAKLPARDRQLLEIVVPTTVCDEKLAPFPDEVPVLASVLAEQALLDHIRKGILPGFVLAPNSSRINMLPQHGALPLLRDKPFGDTYVRLQLLNYQHDTGSKVILLCSDGGMVMAMWHLGVHVVLVHASAWTVPQTVQELERFAFQMVRAHSHLDALRTPGVQEDSAEEPTPGRTTRMRLLRKRISRRLRDGVANILAKFQRD